MVLIHPESAHEVHLCGVLLEIVRVLFLVVFTVEDLWKNPHRELHHAVEGEKEHRSKEGQGHPRLSK